MKHDGQRNLGYTVYPKLLRVDWKETGSQSSYRKDTCFPHWLTDLSANDKITGGGVAAWEILCPGMNKRAGKFIAE